MRIYSAIGSVKATSPQEYYALPALWVEASYCIDAEINRIKKVREK